MSKKDKTYYQVLGLNPDANTADIKRAYRKIVKDRHPDIGHHSKTRREIEQDTEGMLIVIEAYETLKDKQKRSEYDVKIGVTISIPQSFQFEKTSEDQARQIFLSRVFNPSRNSIAKVLSTYKKQIRNLAQDPFDDELVSEFGDYLDRLEATLRKASNLFSNNPAPSSLEPAAHMMRHCIAQAADGLEETRRFCQNYDYDHLSYAENHFKNAADLSRQAYALTRHS